MIPNWLLQRAFLTPNKIALTYNDEQWTFAQLKTEATSLAAKLSTNGLKEGNRIALLGSSNPEMVFIIHACMLAGLEIVMLNNRLTQQEIDWQVEDSDADVILISDDLQSKIANPTYKILLFSDIHESVEVKFNCQDIWEADRTISIMYTSGTTGLPKGVRQTAGNHTSSAISSVLNLGLDETDIWLCAMPLFHISGFSILVRSVLYGMEVRLYEKFDAVQAAKEIVEGTVTRMSVVSLTLDKILRVLETHNLKAHPSFKTMLAGGGSVPVGYLERAYNCHIPVLQTYGMTETSSQTATLTASDAIRKIGSAGKPLFFNQIKIKDVKNAGEKGEVLIRGPHVTPGYIGTFSDLNPLENGWFSTGDIGYIDDEGYLFIVDRRADLIISGGENIYPAEIESILVSHPCILEAGVCGQEHPQWGSVPIAFVVTMGNVNVEELQAYCETHLARFKVPKVFHFVQKLPRNASNKLLRRELKTEPSVGVDD